MKFTRVISMLMCLVIFVGCYTIPIEAKTASQIQAELDRLEKEEKELQKDLNDLKAQKKDKTKIKNSIEAKINNLQSQIDICNDKIEKNNNIIAKNEAEIAKQEKEMDAVLLEFKKRIRSIYMSGGTAGGLEILLGAESFSDFIALSQLTQNVSKRDQKLVDEIVEEIKEIEEKSVENKKLIEELKEVKATLKVKQDQLDKECDEVLKVIADIQKDQNAVNSNLAQNKKEQEKAEQDLEKILQESNNAGIDAPFNGKFIWPCPGYTNISSRYGNRWGKFHKGIDISQGGIGGKKVVAAASGTVIIGCNTCTHNYSKVNSNGTAYSCGCGYGYGNYVMIDHGKHGDYYYRTVYAHLKPDSITVKNGEKVNQGQKIGGVGTTGNSTGNHLHFEIRRGKSKDSLSHVNPEDFV